jgi:hypothetical protein
MSDKFHGQAVCVTYLSIFAAGFGFPPKGMKRESGAKPELFPQL